MLRTRESLVVPLAAATAILSAQSASAQLDLPPPPPPPLGQPNDVPSLPPPPTPPPPDRAPESPRRPTSPPPRIPRSRPAAHPEARPLPVAPPPEPAPHYTVAVTWNPLSLAWGRLSANAEVELSPHHAIAATFSTLVFHADRGSSRDLLSEGFGFASPTSLGFGGELGYHYWLRGLPSLSGVFIGPTLLFGATTQATVGDATHPQGYWGLALDGGIQEVVLGGFTVGGGAGIELIDIAAVTALVPRLLAQVGWSF